MWNNVHSNSSHSFFYLYVYSLESFKIHFQRSRGHQLCHQYDVPVIIHISKTFNVLYNFDGNLQLRNVVLKDKDFSFGK